MPDFATHCMESLAAFGDNHAPVHRWLDEFAGKPPYGMKHRRMRHHLAGIAEAQRLFDGRAGEAAMGHVISDLKMEGWTIQDGLPKDERDYVRMGLF
jgi:hypothetical protein